MLKYILCFVPALLCLILLPLIGFVFSGEFDLLALGTQLSPGETATAEGILAITMVWVIATGLLGVGLTMCMAIYDVFEYMGKRSERRRIEKIMRQSQESESPKTPDVWGDAR